MRVMIPPWPLQQSPLMLSPSLLQSFHLKLLKTVAALAVMSIPSNCIKGLAIFDKGWKIWHATGHGLEHRMSMCLVRRSRDKGRRLPHVTGIHMNPNSFLLTPLIWAAPPKTSSTWTTDSQWTRFFSGGRRERKKTAISGLGYYTFPLLTSFNFIRSFCHQRNR